MTPDEKIEIEEKVADAFDENYEKHDIVARAHTGDNTEEETEDETMDEDKIGSEMETDAEKSDLVEAGNLEQAWQMFDLAKVIYGKAVQVERECEALTYLGEVSLENANFEQAREDLSACLSKRMKTMPSDSRYRSIAETHYQLGVAQAHCARSCATKEMQCQEYDNAEKSLTLAVAVLNARIANLKKLETSESQTLRTSPRSWLSWTSCARRSKNVLPTTRRCRRGPTRRIRTLSPSSKTLKWSRRLASRKLELQPSSR